MVHFTDVKVPVENLIGEEGKAGLTRSIYSSLSEAMRIPTA